MADRSTAAISVQNFSKAYGLISAKLRSVLALGPLARPGDFWICYCGRECADPYQQPFLNGMEGVAVLGCSCGKVVIEGVNPESAATIKKIIELGTS
jgi:hypothetical protein